MNNLQERRQAYVKLNSYITQYRNELRAGGNPPERIIPDFEKHWNKLTKDWTLADFQKLMDLLESEVEIIVNKYRRNPDWRK